MRGLQILVIIMTLTLIGGTGFLGYSIAKKAGELVSTSQPVPITLPKGSAVQHMSAYKNGLALYVSIPGKDDIIYLYNTSTGTVSNQIPVAHAK